MATIDEAAILKRAKELAAQDGFPWQLEYKPSVPRGKINVQPDLSPERRQQYLDRALVELRKEGENA
jgi:hypothetical protein